VTETSIHRHFKHLEDPRLNQRKKYPLINLIFIAFCAVLCGAEDWVSITRSGKARFNWLSQFLVLDLLDLDGATVTIDAMGCQKEISEKIREKNADYLFSLKGNHSNLHDDVRLYFESLHQQKLKTEMFHSYQIEKEHGRIEERDCWSVNLPKGLHSDGWNLVIFATYKSTSYKRKMVNLCCRKQQSLLRILLHLTVMGHGCMGKNQRLLIASIIHQELIFCL
jgi:predicted transposase YbfD/YdcC